MADVVILPEDLQFSFQVTDVPEERLVKVFTANRPDESLNERV